MKPRRYWKCWFCHGVNHENRSVCGHCIRERREA
jgi:hypothetical protein